MEKTFYGTVIDIASPFFIQVPSNTHGDIYRCVIVVLNVADENGNEHTLFYNQTIGHCTFNPAFSKLLFSKGKKMIFTVKEPSRLGVFDGLGLQIVSMQWL